MGVKRITKDLTPDGVCEGNAAVSSRPLMTCEREGGRTVYKRKAGEGYRGSRKHNRSM